MSPAPEPPTRRSSPAPPIELVVAGAAEDQVVAGTAGDDVVDALLTDHEVIGNRGREIDAASVAVGRIRAC